MPRRGKRETPKNPTERPLPTLLRSRTEAETSAHSPRATSSASVVARDRASLREEVSTRPLGLSLFPSAAPLQRGGREGPCRVDIWPPGIAVNATGQLNVYMLRLPRGGARM